MSGYERHIAYIYQYDGMIKGKNVGFIKVENREGQGRVQLFLRHIYGLGQIPLQVFGLKAEDDADVGIFLGQLELADGDGEFLREIADGMAGPDCPFAVLRGVCLRPQSGNQCLAGVWKGNPFDRTRYHEREKAEVRTRTEEPVSAKEESEPVSASGSAEPVSASGSAGPVFASGSAAPVSAGGSAEPVSASGSNAQVSVSGSGAPLQIVYVPEDEMTPEEAPPEPEETAADKAAELEAAAEKAAEPKAEAMLTAPAPAAEAMLTAPVPAAEAVRTAPAVPQPVRAEEASAAMAVSPAAERFYSPVWEVLNRRYGKCRPFMDDRGIQCIQVKPADLSRLARAYRSLSGNSFLLHGYYRYNHLLLIRMEAAVYEQRLTAGRGRPGGNPHYLLGVPGYYQSSEKSMAGMFGFTEFLPASARVGTGDGFGYWCTEVQL